MNNRGRREVFCDVDMPILEAPIKPRFMPWAQIQCTDFDLRLIETLGDVGRQKHIVYIHEADKALYLAIIVPR